MDEKVSIRIEPAGVEIQVNKGTTYRDILHEYGVEFPCGGKKRCGKCRIELLSGSVSQGMEVIQFESNPEIVSHILLACQSSASDDAVIRVPQWEHIILADETEFSAIPGEGYGIAVDLGTTTLVAQLIDKQTGKIRDVKTALNPQARYGADIISRIEYAMTGSLSSVPGEKNLSQQGSAILCDLIRREVGNMIAGMTRENLLEVNQVVLVGNAVMYHLFGGIDITPLSCYPFLSPVNGYLNYTARQLGWKLNDSCRITFMPWIGGFVGSDILAGIFATRMHEAKETVVLIDLGTNGEIAVGNRERILCASAAAGPAFEGSCIDMGMRASFGAISSVAWEKGGISVKVIGNEEPRGICGSGLLDAVAVLLQTGQIDAFGNISDGQEKVQLSGKVFLSQKDIREFQLAKAAIAAGLDILMKEAGTRYEEVSKIYISGAFGTYLSVENIVQTGMIECDPEKIVKLGNTALMGAKILMFASEKEIGRVAGMIEHTGLESKPEFQEVFAAKMFFLPDML